MEDLGNDRWIDPLAFELAVSKTLFKKQCSTYLTKGILTKQAPFIAMRKKITDDPTCVPVIDDLFKMLKETETVLTQAMEKPEEWEAESSAQLVFTQEWSKPLNQIPILLPATAIFKIYVFPFFAVTLPLIAWVLPFFIVRYFFNLPITLEHYIQMGTSMWLGGKIWKDIDFWGQIRVLFQTCWTAFGLFQGILQPVQQAFHIKKIDDSIVERGLLYQRFAQDAGRLFELCSVKAPYLGEWPLTEFRQLYAYVRDHPDDVKWIWAELARLEICWRIARCKDLCFVQFRHVTGPYCLLRNFFDPSISADRRVASSFMIKSGNSHCVITGPNKGGKSSVLRALLLNIRLAQRFGVAFATSMEMRPFDWIESGLRLADQPGSQSLFERELSFASKLLQKCANKTKVGLILYDECFHSTNPPDGQKTAELFLQNLWTNPNIGSAVSTHVFSLLEKAPSTVKKLCVPAKQTPSGLIYQFSLVPGICTVSSVEELYEKHNFPKTAGKQGI